ncbi:LuxR C-terminal-related transcriptional regulator [Thiotrichales bacterium 19X7-9]|nr:LuxR C-terminal-related transcriptional regulator [Thiotrichales bacterium 19X7-9]
MSEINKKISKHNIELIYINKRVGEKSCLLFNDGDLAKKYILSDLFESGKLKMNYFDIPYDVHLISSFYSDDVNRLLCDITDNELYNYYYYCNEYCNSKMIYVFKYIYPESTVNKLLYKDAIHNKIKIIANYLQSKYSNEFQKMNGYMIDLNLLGASYTQKLNVSKEMLNLYNEIMSSTYKLIPLSPTQQKIAWYIIQGYSLNSIAVELNISFNTAVSYFGVIKEKLNFSTKQELISLIYNHPYLLGDKNMKKVMYGLSIS